MICFICTAAHSYTFRKYLPLFAGVPAFQVWSYDRLFRARSLPRATWIFTDFDRLNFWELELAARLYRNVVGAGQRALNDPAIVAQRFSLLRRLYRAGFNRFNVWSIEAEEWPERYPVFLRTQSAHRGALSELIPDRTSLEGVIEAALAKGRPRRELMIVEYCAEPVREDLFRKLAMYRVGPTMVANLCVHQSKWVAKDGEKGIAGQELYDDEYRIIEENRHGEELRPAFDLGGIEFGRADFGLVGGRPQVYEINTNPTIVVMRKHPFPIRIAASRLFEDKLAAALAAIDTPAGGMPIKVKGTVLREQRAHDRLMTRSRWVV
ncbi:MAG TPA: hypothetical protein VFG64_04710 [Dongiaceae bacterium]|nr:hypothetical protein [Dongiaceae bacterium]